MLIPCKYASYTLNAPPRPPSPPPPLVLSPPPFPSPRFGAFFLIFLDGNPGRAALELVLTLLKKEKNKKRRKKTKKRRKEEKMEEKRSPPPPRCLALWLAGRGGGGGWGWGAVASVRKRSETPPKPVPVSQKKRTKTTKKKKENKTERRRQKKKKINKKNNSGFCVCCGKLKITEKGGGVRAWGRWRLWATSGTSRWGHLGTTRVVLSPRGGEAKEWVPPGSGWWVSPPCPQGRGRQHRSPRGCHQWLRVKDRLLVLRGG